MSPIDEPSTFIPKPAPAESAKAKPAPATATEPPVTTSLVAFTIDAETGRVIKLERVGPSGDRSDITDEAKTALTEKAAKANLQSIVEQAFEAGVHSVLGSDTSDDADDEESEDDADLRRILLKSLIERSAAKRLIQREVLGPAIVGTLITQGLAARAAPGTSAAH